MEPTLLSSTALAPSPASVRDARRFFTASTSRLGLTPDVVELGSLAVSELVTNAICHGASPIEIRTMSDAAEVRFEVSDSGPGMPRSGPVAPLATGGRGLGIVAAITDAWGCERNRNGPGKTMWFTLMRRRVTS